MEEPEFDTASENIVREKFKGADGKEYAVALNIEKCSFSAGKVVPQIKIKSEGKLLTAGTDYKIIVKNGKNANMIYDPATDSFKKDSSRKQPAITVKFIKAYKAAGKHMVDYDIRPTSLEKAVITPKAPELNAKEGKKIRFVKSVTVPVGSKTKKLSTRKDLDADKTVLISASDGKTYNMEQSVSAPAGSYYISVTGKGNYYGTVSGNTAIKVNRIR